MRAARPAKVGATSNPQVGERDQAVAGETVHVDLALHVEA